MHPLDGADEQVNGAREHLDALRPEILAFAKVVTDSTSLNYQKGVVSIKGRDIEVPFGTAIAPVNLPPPLRCRRLIAETIQNLRAALDYLVYEMACYDAKAIVEKTQFVIVDCEKDFLAQKWHLRGMSGYHIAMIQRLQPYAGCHWTTLLRDLSNPSKHERLTAVKHPVIFSISDANTQAILAGKHVDVNDYASVRISFSNGPPVIESLEQLVLDVAHTLDAFKPEFK